MPAWLHDRLPMLGFGSVWVQRWRLFAIAAVYSAVAVTIYLTAGLGQWSPQFTPVGRSLVLVAGFFVLPSLLEELAWRWLLIGPSYVGKLDRRAAVRIALSSVIFTAAHPVAATLFVPHARDLFFRGEFLAIVFLLGLACGSSYVIARSIWPAVMLHWLTVLAWKFLLGGPFIMLGR